LIFFSEFKVDRNHIKSKILNETFKEHRASCHCWLVVDTSKRKYLQIWTFYLINKWIMYTNSRTHRYSDRHSAVLMNMVGTDGKYVWQIEAFLFCKMVTSLFLLKNKNSSIYGI